MKTTKKIIAIALSVMLLLSVMPLAAFAASENLSDIIAGATDKYVEITDTDIVVDQDITLSNNILDLYGDITIDLNGHNIIAGAQTSEQKELAIWINPGANVTITDSAQPSTAATYSSSTGVLTVKSGVAAISSTNIAIMNQGALTIGKAVVKGDKYGVCLADNSTLTTTQTNSIICGGTYAVAYPATNTTLNLNSGKIYGQYGLSGNSSWDAANSQYKFGGNTINIGSAKIYGKGMDDENDGIVNGAAIVLGADDDCNITGAAEIYGYDAPAIVVRASADLDITGSAKVITNGDLSSVKVLDGSTAVPCSPVAIDTACGYTKADDIDVDLTAGTYTSNVTDVPAVAFEGKAGDEVEDYITVTGGSYTSNGAPDATVPVDDTYVQDDFGKLFLASEIGTKYNVKYTNASGKATYVAFSSTVFSGSGTYQLLDDVSINLRLAPGTFASNVVLDMNGYNLTSTASDYIFLISRNGSASAHKTFDIVNTSETPSVIEATQDSCEGACINGAYNDFTLGTNVTLKTKNVSAWLGGSGTNSTMTINGDVESSDCFALYVHGTNTNQNNVVTVNGNVKGADAGIYAAGVANYEINGNVTGNTGIYVAQGTVNVNDGAKVTGTGANNDYQYYGSGMYSTGDGIAVDSKYATVPTVNVNEGATVESKAADGVAEYQKSEETPAPVVDVDEDATIIENHYNVEFTSASGAVSYKNFSSSFSSNGTYKLLDDVTVSLRISPTVFTSNVVIDMNGKNLTSSAPDEVFILGRNGTESAHKTWSVINTSATPSVIEATNPDCDGVVITGRYNDFTLGENVTLKTKDVAAWIGETNANNSITIDGDVETSDCFALYVHGTNPGPNTVTVNGNVTGDEVGIYGAGNANYVINGNVTGDTGVYIKSGTLTVNDGATVTGTGAKAAYTYNGSGVNATGDAIVIDNCGYPGGTPDANISGGTIISDNGTAVASYVKQDDQTQTGSFDRIEDVVPEDSTVKLSDKIDYDLIPEDMKLTDNGDGTYSLAEVHADNGANLILEGNVEEAIFIDADEYELGSDAVIKVTANVNSNISEEPDVQTKTYRVSSLTPYDEEGQFYGTYRFTVKNAAAQVTEPVTVALYQNAEAENPVKTITYSVKQYCDDTIATSNDAYLVALCKSILDYGAAAQTYFGYNTSSMATDEYFNDDVQTLEAGEIQDAYFDSDFAILGGSFVCLDTTDMNLYFKDSRVKVNNVYLDGVNDSAIKATAKVKNNSRYLNITDIEAGNLLKIFTVETPIGNVSMNSQFLVKTILNSNEPAEHKDLARSIYCYAQAANNYFPD